MDNKLHQHASHRLSKKEVSLSIRTWGNEIIRWVGRIACIIVALNVYFREDNLVWFLVLMGIALGELTISEILKNVRLQPPPEN